MRSSGLLKSGAILALVGIVATTLIAAGASAATIVLGTVHVKFGDSFPDPATWAMMLASFGVIGAGIRSRKRSVVLA